MQYACKQGDDSVEYPYTYDMLRASTPDICWPDRVSEVLLAGYGMQYVAPSQRPNHNQATQKIICRVDTSAPTWFEVWSVVDLTENEKEQVRLDEIERIRNIRNVFLQEVDAISAVRWAMMPKTQQTAWKNYRQGLLDVPEQVGFPFSIDWPIKPS